MKPSFSILLSTIFLLLVSGLLAQKQEAEIGSEATLHCKGKAKATDCTWTPAKDDKMILKNTFPNDYPDGYSLEFNSAIGTCDLKIASVKPKDSDTWKCVIDVTGSQVDFVVTKRPEQNTLKYNKLPVFNGEIIGVEPDTEGKVQVACESKSGLPRPDITWKVNGQDATGNFTEVSLTDKGYHVKSELTLTYPVPEDPMGYANIPAKHPKKQVYCTIKYSQDDAKAIELHATFVKNGKTTIAHLKKLRGNNDKEGILGCDADGFPEPEYLIMRTEPNPETNVRYSQNRTVTEKGKYICKARNYLNLRPIESNTVEFDPNSSSMSKPATWTLATAFITIVLRRFLGC